jgi:hypothetical protein
MANSLLIPIQQPPSSVSEIQSLVEGAFRELGKPMPRFSLRRSDDKPATDLTSSFVMIQGDRAQDCCWVSTDPVPVSLTEHPDCPYLVGVTTRGDWKFAAVVAYAFSKRAGTRVFNDSGVLDGQPQYDAHSLKQAIVA